MSRRCHHGSPRHLRQAARERRRGPALAERPPTVADDRPLEAPPDDLGEPAEGAPDGGSAAAEAATSPTDAVAPPSEPVALGERAAPDMPVAEVAAPPTVPAPAPARLRVPEPSRLAPPTGAAVPPIRPPHHRAAGPDAGASPSEVGGDRGATAPQLRRFIKSRAYVPMHELRRRFAINGGDDDVIPIDVDRQRVYVGLPPREGSLLGELLRAGDIGYELSMDPIAPIVVGVYPMRPVPRS